MTQPGDLGAGYGYPGQANRQWNTQGPWPAEYDPQAHLRRLGYPQLLSPGRPAPAHRPRKPHQYRPPQDYGYSRQPAYSRQPQYAPQPPYRPEPRYVSPPYRDDPHTVRNVLVGVGGLAVAVAGIVAAIGAGHVGKTSTSALVQRASGASLGKTAGIG